MKHWPGTYGDYQYCIYLRNGIKFFFRGNGFMESFEKHIAQFPRERWIRIGNNIITISDIMGIEFMEEGVTSWETPCEEDYDY